MINFPLLAPALHRIKRYYIFKLTELHNIATKYQNVWNSVNDRKYMYIHHTLNVLQMKQTNDILSNDIMSTDFWQAKKCYSTGLE